MGLFLDTSDAISTSVPDGLTIPAGVSTGTFPITTHSVTAALKRWGGITAAPKNRQDRARVQAAFNHWAVESGRPLCQLSLILAASVED